MTPEEEKPAEQPAPVEDPRVAEMQLQMSQLIEQNKEYQGLLTDGNFASYVAEKAAAAVKAEDKGGDKVDIEDFSKKDLAAYILENVKGIVNSAIQPITQTQAVTAAQKSVTEAEAKYPDFWEFKDEMIRVSQQLPNVTAEQAYHIAKGTKDKTVAKPTGKKVAMTEPPTNTGPGKHAPAKGFNPKFDKAWKEIFGTAESTH